MSRTSVKKSPLAMWVQKAIAVASVGVALGVAAACGSDNPPADIVNKCKLNSECSSGLVCSFGLCHAECEKVRDCPANQRCVTVYPDDAGGQTTKLCQLQEEAKCQYNSDCHN